MKGCDYLFVYGTLRNGYNLDVKDQLSADLEYIGKARVDASLYDIGEYPGAVKERTKKSEIIGDVYLITNPEHVFSVLDEYEGYEQEKVEESEFVRETDKVRLSSGGSIDAWIYWYNRSPQGKSKIRYKDYLNYLKNKKRRRNATKAAIIYK